MLRIYSAAQIEGPSMTPYQTWRDSVSVALLMETLLMETLLIGIFNVLSPDISVCTNNFSRFLLKTIRHRGFSSDDDY